MSKESAPLIPDTFEGLAIPKITPKELSVAVCLAAFQIRKCDMKCTDCIHGVLNREVFERALKAGKVI